jgi:pimeloyl-ACP methyl ester carboxylesterase
MARTWEGEGHQRRYFRTDKLSSQYNHVVTSTRFANPLKQNIQHAELVIFEGCAHAPIYEKVDEFNQTTLEFLKRHAG